MIEYHPNTFGSSDCLSFDVKKTALSADISQYEVLSPSNEKLLSIEMPNNTRLTHTFFVNKGGLVLGVKQEAQPWQFIVKGQSISLSNYKAQFHGQTKPLNEVASATHTMQTVTDQAMILAAGFATRLEPISGELTGLSKPALPLKNGLSVIQVMVEHLISFGIKKIIVNTSFLPEPIHQQLEKYSNQIEIKIIPEDTPSGTAGGLLKAFELGYVDANKPILIVQGDAVSNFDLGHLLNQHQVQNADVTIAGMRVLPEEVHRFGIIETSHTFEENLSGLITGFLEKPSLEIAGNRRFANTGFYILNQSIFNLFQQVGRKQFEENEIYDFANHFFPVVLHHQNTNSQPDLKFWAEELTGHWSDIGAPEEYNLFNINKSVEV